MGSDSEVVGEVMEQTKLATEENPKGAHAHGEQSDVEACTTKDSVVIADADDTKTMARSADSGIETLESPSQESGKPIAASHNANEKCTEEGGETLTPGALQSSAGATEDMKSGNQQADANKQATVSPGNQSKESVLETQQQEATEATGRQGQENKAPGAPNASMQPGQEIPKQTVETAAQHSTKDLKPEQSSGQTSDTMNSVPALEQSTHGLQQTSGSPGSSCDQAQPPVLAMVSATPSTEGTKPSVTQSTQCQGSVSQSIPATQQQQDSNGLKPQQVTQPSSAQHQQQVTQQGPQHVLGQMQSSGLQSVASNAMTGQHAMQQQQQQHPQQQHHHQQQVAHPQQQQVQQQQVQQQQTYAHQGQAMVHQNQFQPQQQSNVQQPMVMQNQLQTSSTQMGQQMTMHNQQMVMQQPQHVMQQQGMHQPQVPMMQQQQQMPTQHMQMQQQPLMMQQQVQPHQQQQAVMQSPRPQMMQGVVQQQHVGAMTPPMQPMQTPMQSQGVFQQQGYQHGGSSYMVGAPATASSPPRAMIIQQAPAGMVSPGFAPGDFGSWAPFTTAQWHELEQQAMVFKYLVAGAPVPQELVDSMRMSLSASIASQQGHMISFGQPMWGAQVDPEPFRCRRTDGKKWRCSREVVHDQKYCERHMHRGRNRARKINDKSTPGSSLVSADEQSELHKSASQGGASELAPEEPGAAKLDRSESMVGVSSGGPPPLALPPSAHNGAQAAAPQQPQQPQQQQPQYLMHPQHAQGQQATMSAANQQGQPPSHARPPQPMQVFPGGQGQGPAVVQPQYNGNVAQQIRPGPMASHQDQQQWQQSQPGAVGYQGQAQNQGTMPNQQPVQYMGTVPAQNGFQPQQGVQGGMVQQPQMQMGPQQQYQQPVQQAYTPQAQQAQGGYAPQFGTQAVQQPMQQGQYQRTQGSTYMPQGQSASQSAPSMYQMGPNGSKGGQTYVTTGQGQPQLQQQGHPAAQVSGFQGNPQQYGQYPQGQVQQMTQQQGTAGYATQQQPQVYQQPTIQQSQALARSESQYSSQSSLGGIGEPGTSQHQQQPQQQQLQQQQQQQQPPQQQQQQQQFYRPGQVMQQTYQGSGYVSQQQQGGVGMPGQYGGPVQADVQYQAQQQQPTGTPGSADGKVPLLRVPSVMPASGGGNGPSPPPSQPGQLTRTPSHTQPYSQAAAQHSHGAITSQSAQQQPMQQHHSGGPIQYNATQAVQEGGTVRWGVAGQASISPTKVQPGEAGPAMQAQQDWAMGRPGQHTVTQNSTGMVAYHTAAPLQFHPGYGGKMELARSMPRKAGGESMLLDQSTDGNGSSAISPNCVLQRQHCHSDSSSAESPMGPLSMGENHGSVATGYHGMQGQASVEGSMVSSQANN